MPKLRSPRGIILLVAGVLLVVLVVVGASLISTQVQTDTVRDNFTAAEARVIHQVEADDDAHAALATVEGSGFATSAGTVVSALTSCMGKSATATTTGGLTQLAGFAALPGAPRDVLTFVNVPTTQAEYLADAKRLLAQLTADKANTAETAAVTQSNLIAQDEVNQDLDAIAAGIGGTSVKLVSKDVYATKTVKGTYSKSAAGLATVVAQIAPSLTAKKPVKISSANSTTLMTALTTFATACKAEAASSKAHKPKPVVHSGVSSAYPDWHLATWFLYDAHIDNEFSVSAYTNTNLELTCASSKLLEEGTLTGKVGTRGSAPSFRTSTVPSVKFLQRNVNATTVQWAWVECK